MKKLLGTALVGLSTFSYSMAGGAMEISSKMMVDPAYDPNVVTLNRYIYTGEIDLSLSGFDVYQSVNTITQNPSLKSAMDKIDINGIDLSKFGDKSLSNISFYNKDYYIYIDFERGYFSVYQNYKNQIVETQQKDVAALPQEETIKIAKDFLSNLKVVLSAYGDPIIENHQIMLYKSATDNYTNPYVEVVFPKKLDGKNVSYRYGGIDGLRITVSNVTKSVQGFSLKFEKFNKSTGFNYLTDLSEIKKKIANGGYDYDYQYPENVKVQYNDVYLKDPKIQYVDHYDYKDVEGKTYYVPALVFDVVQPENMNTDGNYIYVGNSVTVPLVKEAYVQPVAY